jgi:2-alkenal reductase
MLIDFSNPIEVGKGYPRMSLNPKTTKLSAVLIIVAVCIGTVSGSLISYAIVSRQINDLESQVSSLRVQLASQNRVQSITYMAAENVSLTKLYGHARNSVVTIRGVVEQSGFFGSYYTEVEGSGFVYNFSGKMVILTNHHVVYNAANISVTFADGDGYGATVLGADPYEDLAVLSVAAPESEYKPLEILSSQTLKVGDSVIAIGNPYGLSGSMTVGIVSALGRTITEETTGGYSIANIIQITAPINPGNSGGPLLNYEGQVVGITAAIVVNSQGIGFAIPSSTILREIKSLIINGSYNQHPWLGASGVDMTYEIAEAMDSKVTYGWLITKVANGGPADQAGLRGGTRQTQIEGRTLAIGGDIVVAIDGTRVISIDDASTYLEEQTLPGQTITITIVRDNQLLTLTVKLGTRPVAST